MSLMPRRASIVTLDTSGPIVVHMHEDQAQGHTFTFPDIFPEKDGTPAEGSMEEMQEKFIEDEKQRQKSDPRRGGVTEWFGL
ncbi:hypothetical protein F2P81_007240 [Scophthalmus maximus]|uniref:Uncharacterized protein n=1 Tax=Scophthalmus maximus TaxID=52904 RepID=A0A6A4TGV0_SCOMX|nr:hypothetical protein F2P81_007240 [Scophthalmus maximus]